ncbi:MAG: PAS domain S-box protein [Deltaproteobacteria bacterium]|nr:PAS domain S-box protein [Deltaproteobacteria bacterium]
MHPFVLISLLAAVAAGMLAGAIWARDPGNRGNRLAAATLACAVIWAICDVFSNLVADPATALVFVRLSCIGSLMIGALALDMLVTLEPKLVQRYSRFVPFTYGSAAIAIVVALTTPAFWSDVTRVEWGWSGDVGFGVAVAWAVIIPLPTAALVEWFWSRDDSAKMDTWMGIAVGIPALAASLTDFVLPFAGVHFPHLGSASLVAWGGLALWKIYRFRDPILAPHLFAGEILATLPDGVTLLRLDGTIRSVNRKMAELVGAEPSDLLGLRIDEILVDLATPRSRVHGDRERRLVRSDGEEVIVLVDETRLFDEDGDCLGKVIVVRDLREVASLRNRLVTSGRLAAVGQLAAGIAHEINNPIAYVQSNINMLEEHWETVKTEFAKNEHEAEVATIFAGGREMIEELRDGLTRVTAIVRDVGGFSRNSGPEKESSDINKLLETAVRVAQPQLRQRAEITRGFADLPLVPCVPLELMQVFLNLLLNAAHSIEPMGEIQLETETCGDWVEIRVTDNGAGMDSATQAQIFTPFFTTKPVGEGTGLGLPISRQIVEKHGGTIDVESARGVGTTFRIRMPCEVGNEAEAAG